MDVMSDILTALNLQGSLYFSTEFNLPWGVQVPALENVARFHLVMRGTCWVRVRGEREPVRLESGDLVLVPHGAEHVLSDPPDAKAPVVDEVVSRAGFTGRGALIHGGEDRGNPTRLLCGHFTFREGASHPLLARLPPRIVVRADEAARHVRVEDVFRGILCEVRDGRPGSDAIVRRLSEVLFIQAIRIWAERESAEAGIAAALAEPRIARSLAAIHASPARPWTLAGLAREAGLSRTAFAERFQRRMSLTPMQYVAFWRMQQARQMLADRELTIEDVSSRVGYRSVAAFTRVFRKWAGRTPGAFRRDAMPRAT